MIIKVLDQTIDLTIPKKYLKFTDETIKELTELGLFNDVDQYYTPRDGVLKNEWTDLYFKYDNDDRCEEREVKTLGIWCSGGADSSMLLYLLAKTIKDEELDIMLQPLSVRRGRPWNPVYAGNVIDFIIDDLNFKNMKPHEIYYPDINDEYQREDKEFRERDMKNFNSNFFDIMYSGITTNPPENDKTISKNKERSRDESSERPLVNKSRMAYYINPFFRINKKHVAQLYKQYEVIDTLFPITRSCEGFDVDTGNYTYHCGKCWWCEERLWAFGRLV